MQMRDGTETAAAERFAPPGWALVAVAVVHVAVALTVFPIGEIFADTPFLNDDMPPKFLAGEQRGRMLLAGELTAYEPRFAAGLPFTARLPWGGPSVDLVMAAFGPVAGWARAFNLSVFLYTLLVLPLSWCGARLGGLDREAARWVPIVGLPVVWSGVPLSFATQGGSAWLLASALLPWVCFAVWRAVVAPSPRRALLACLAASLLPVVHALLVLPVLLAVGGVWLVRRPPLGRAGPTLVAIAGTAVAANAFWWVPFVRRAADSASLGVGTAGVFDLGFALVALVHPHGLAAVVPLYVLAALGLARGRWPAGDGASRLLVGAILAASLAIATLGYVVGALAVVEPYRYVLPFLLALPLPAAVALATCVPRRVGLATALGAPVLAVALAAWNPFLVSLRVRSTPPDALVSLVEMVRRNVPGDGRVLIEDSAWSRPGESWQVNVGAPTERYFGGHVPTLLPRLTGRQFVNGLYPGRFLRHQVVQLESGRFQGRDVAAWTEGELRALLERYAVSHVLVWSAETRTAFVRHTDLVEPVDGVDGFELLRVVNPTTTWVAGSGRIELGLDRVVLSDVEPTDGAVVLRFHHDPALRAVPAATIERVEVDGDPVGFVRILDPPERLVLGFHPDGDLRPGWVAPWVTPAPDS